jgi:hypothetical protein
LVTDDGDDDCDNDGCNDAGLTGREDEEGHIEAIDPMGMSAQLVIGFAAGEEDEEAFVHDSINFPKWTSSSWRNLATSVLVKGFFGRRVEWWRRNPSEAAGAA